MASLRPAIAPSILSFNPADYRTPTKAVVEGGADWIHFDVMDGVFVPPITFGAGLVESLRKDVQIPFEVHLMTVHPEQHFDAFIKAGCIRVIFHHEATDHSHRLCQSLKDQGVEAGVAINPGTPVESLFPLIGVMDLALIMTVNPGWGGQQMIEACLPKIRALRSAAPQLEIEVDGGVDDTTIGSLYDAGANTFVTGSYLAKADSMSDAIATLRDRCGSKL